MEVLVECLYCGHKTELNVYSTALLDDRRCDKCKDKNKRIKKVENKDIFGYNYKEEDKTE